MKLGEIADIRSGLVLVRKKALVDYEIENTYKLITLRNIEDNGMFTEAAFETFASTDVLNKEYFTSVGDILIRLSAPYTAVNIIKRAAGLLVPSYFSIIRLKTDKYIPEYLTWYLNSDKVKKELIKSQAGTAMATTNNKILSALEIKELPMAYQQRIAKIRQLYLEERELLNRLIKAKEKYYQGITNKLINLS